MQYKPLLDVTCKTVANMIKGETFLHLSLSPFFYPSHFLFFLSLSLFFFILFAGKSPAEIRKTFNIKNEFTPEEEEAIRRENEWCEEGDGNNNNHA